MAPPPSRHDGLIERLRTDFLPAILHGDEDHRAWLTSAVDAFIAGEPVPPPRGSGNKEAAITRLTTELAGARGALATVTNACSTIWQYRTLVVHTLRNDNEAMRSAERAFDKAWEANRLARTALKETSNAG